MALTSAALTLIHNLLHCDPNQAECHQLRSAYLELGTQYGSLDVLTDKAQIQKRLVELDKARSTIVGTATATAAPWSTTLAERSIP